MVIKKFFHPLFVMKIALLGQAIYPNLKKIYLKLKGQILFNSNCRGSFNKYFFRNDVIEESSLPINLVAYSACFRSEAGSYGKDVKGLISQHQFNKVELVKISSPINSKIEHESLTNDAVKS